MSLAMIGRGASFEFRWRRWALLRDFIEAKLEAGPGGGDVLEFPRFKSIGDALREGTIKIRAAELASELATLVKVLAGHVLEELVIGPRTAAALYFKDKPMDAPRPLTQVELGNLGPTGDIKDLAQYFAPMLGSMTHVCEHPLADGAIEIVDG